MRTFLTICLFVTLAGCRSASRRLEYAAPPLPVRPPVAIAFVANGSGDYRTVSDNLSRVVEQTGAALAVEPFIWSHGRGRYVRDHVDRDNQLAMGRALAERVVAYRRAYPGRRVHLVGHSTGGAVVLAAAEALPPDSIDRIVLLAPAVCTAYDLRPALRTARCGIDVYHSERDRMVLGLGMRIVGTADDASCRTAAGQYGFTPILCDPQDAALYTRLRQHPWDRALLWTGNRGGHYGSHTPDYLRAYVLPLLMAP